MKMRETSREQDKELVVNHKVFINPERISPPDIDMDFEDSRRQDVIDYIKDKYGSEKVSNIITFGTLAARNVIRDVGRVLESNTQMIDALAKSVPAEPKMTLEKAMGVSPDFIKLYNEDEEAKKVVDIAFKLVYINQVTR